MKALFPTVLKYNLSIINVFHQPILKKYTAHFVMPIKWEKIKTILK